MQSDTDKIAWPKSSLNYSSDLITIGIKMPNPNMRIRNPITKNIENFTPFGSVEVISLLSFRSFQIRETKTKHYTLLLLLCQDGK